MDELIKKIKEVAHQSANLDSDDFCPSDYGSFDDVYEFGKEDGIICFARQLLDILENSG